MPELLYKPPEYGSIFAYGKTIKPGNQEQDLPLKKDKEAHRDQGSRKSCPIEEESPPIMSKKHFHQEVFFTILTL